MENGDIKWEKIPSPEAFFGFRPGADYHMIRWRDLCRYYYLLGEMSDRILVEHVGPTSEGNPYLMIYVSEKENLEKIELYRKISCQLADPRGLAEEVIDALVEEGKAICMQSYGLHSNEVGGPQMVPIMLYDLITRDDEYKQILENVIFIVLPCSEPDGEIIFTNWYNKYLETPYEGICSPYLRHNWAGHANDCDAIYERVIESKYINDILIRDWKPQAFQDHHHAYPYENRMSITPISDPIYEPISPITLREQTVYGAEIAQTMSCVGRKGVVMGDDFYCFEPIDAFHNNALLHNTVGMLTESADVFIATPAYIHKEQIRGCTVASDKCPDPWEGGEWHLSDIVEQMYLASIAILRYMAENRKKVLKQMALKALLQTRRGLENKKKAYLISIDQHDASALKQFLQMMKNQDIEFFALNQSLRCGSQLFPKGTVVVPLSQPNYAAVELFLACGPYPVGKYNTRDDGSICVFDTANLSIALRTGIHVVPTMQNIDSSLLETYEFEDEILSFPLLATENESYKIANQLMDKGVELYRTKTGDFYDHQVEEAVPVKRTLVGLLKRSATGNSEEGFTRNLLKTYHFDYRIVMDRELRNNSPLADVDVLIIPGDTPEELKSGDVQPENLPKEYQSGLGKIGAETLRSFVDRGGRLIGWGHSSNYICEVFSFDLKDNSEGKSRTEYMTANSQLRACAKEDVLTRGMPKVFTLTHSDGPIFYPGDYRGKIEVIARLCDADEVYVNGCIKGKEFFADTPCIVRLKYGKGEIILYSFNPQFRMQQEGTFKLLFNALY